MSTKCVDDLLFALSQDLGEEVRKRRDPEYIYTAAAVGSFGAVSWGVASLSAAGPHGMIPAWAAPATVAAIGTALLTAAVIYKIIQDHSAYVGLRTEQVRIVGLLATGLGAKAEDVPKRYREVGSARGYLWSILVVAAAALGAIAFCLSIQFGFGR